MRHQGGAATSKLKANEGFPHWIIPHAANSKNCATRRSCWAMSLFTTLLAWPFRNMCSDPAGTGEQEFSVSQHSALWAGRFNAWESIDPMLGRARKATSASLIIVSMSPPVGYRPAWLLPGRARFRFNWHQLNIARNQGSLLARFPVTMELAACDSPEILERRSASRSGYASVARHRALPGASHTRKIIGKPCAKGLHDRQGPERSLARHRQDVPPGCRRSRIRVYRVDVP